jgi:hypothetical protein
MKLAEKIKQEISKNLDYSEVERVFTDFFMSNPSGRIIVNFGWLLPSDPPIVLDKEIAYLKAEYASNFIEWAEGNGFRCVIHFGGSGQIHSIYVTLL